MVYMSLSLSLVLYVKMINTGILEFTLIGKGTRGQEWGIKCYSRWAALSRLKICPKPEC